MIENRKMVERFALAKQITDYNIEHVLRYVGRFELARTCGWASLSLMVMGVFTHYATVYRETAVFALVFGGFLGAFSLLMAFPENDGSVRLAKSWIRETREFRKLFSAEAYRHLVLDQHRSEHVLMTDDHDFGPRYILDLRDQWNTLYGSDSADREGDTEMIRERYEAMCTCAGYFYNIPYFGDGHLSSVPRESAAVL